MIPSIIDSLGRRFGGEITLDPSMTMSQDASGRNLLTGAAGLFTQLGTGADVRPSLDKMRERLSIDDFTGGGPDDTIQFQRAIAEATNRELWLKQGQTYTVSDSLPLPVGCRIMGNEATILNDITTPLQLFVITESRCGIRDLAITNLHSDSNVDGMLYGAQRSSPICVGSPGNLAWIEDTELHNIEITGGIEETTGIVAGFGMVRGVRLTHCYVDGNFLTSFHIEWNNPTGPVPSGIVSPHAIKFASCRATNNAATIGAAFRNAYYFAGAYQVSMEDCLAQDVIGGVYLSNGDTGVETGHHETYRISRMEILNYAANGLTIQGSNTPTEIATIVEDCLISSVDATGATGTQAIRIFENAGGPVIRRNRIVHARSGIVASDSPDFTIEANVFDDLRDYAVYLIRSADVKVHRNIIRDVSKASQASSTDCAIRMDASPRVEICNNRFGYVAQATPPYIWVTAIPDATVGNRSPHCRANGNLFHTTPSGVMIANGDASYGYTHPMFTSGNHMYYRLDTLGAGVTAPFIDETAGRRVTWTAAGAAPTDGHWDVGDLAWNLNWTSGDPDYSICTAAGDPGTWQTSLGTPVIARETIDGFYHAAIALSESGNLTRGNGTIFLAADTGYVSKIYVRLVSAGVLTVLTAGSITFTVNVNGTGTGLAGTISAGQSSLTVGTGTSIAFATGGRVEIAYTASGTLAPSGTLDIEAVLLVDYP